MDNLTDCDIGCINMLCGSSFFRSRSTTVYCSVKAVNDTSPHSDSNCYKLEVYWNEGHSRSKNAYFAYIIERNLHRVVQDKLHRLFVLELWVSVGVRNTLMCGFNAAILALVDAGVPLKNMLYASDFDDRTEGMLIFDDNGHVFAHCFGDISEKNIESAKKKLLPIKDVMRLKIESKCKFRFSGI